MKMKYRRKGGWMGEMVRNKRSMRLLCVGLGCLLFVWGAKWWRKGYQPQNAGITNTFQSRCEDIPDFGEIDGNLFCPGSQGFAKASEIFSIRARREPLVVMQPKNPEAVAQILRSAVKHNIPVTIKGGGHSPAGWSIEEGAIMIDMSLMREVKVDPVKKTFLAGGGALWSEVVPRVAAHNLAYVGGECPQVGVVGVALGGGTGWLSRSYGLVSDSILRLEMVLPNGTIIEVSQTQHPELLWALSGAGHGNFGVITSIEYQLYDAHPSYFAGNLCFTVSSAEEMKRFSRAYSEALNKINDNRLTVYYVLKRSFHRERVENGVCYTLVFNGPKEEGLHVSQPLLDGIAGALDIDSACRMSPRCSTKQGASLSEHLVAMRNRTKSGEFFVQGKTFTQISNMYGGNAAYMYWKNGVLDDLPEPSMDAIVDALFDDQVEVNNRGTATQVQINHNAGAIDEKPNNFSSFPYRKSKHVVALHGMVIGASDSMSVSKTADKSVHNWTTRAYKKLQPLFSGAYSNYNDADLDEWARLYYGVNLEKLIRIKESIEGYQIFRTAQKL